MQNIVNRKKLFNVPIDIISYKAALQLLLEMAETNSKYIVFTPNVHHVYLVNTFEYFKEAYDACSLSLIDGLPLIWALKYLHGIRTEKVSGSDIFVCLYKNAYDRGLRIFLLGGMPGVAEIAAENLKKKSAQSNKVACFSPKLGFEFDGNVNAKVIQKINDFKPNILFVALGAPKGELWIYNNIKMLNANVIIEVGGSIDFAAGVQRRAPKTFQKIGLEWFFRLCSNPKRLFHRYLTSNTFFLKLIIKDFFKK